MEPFRVLLVAEGLADTATAARVLATGPHPVSVHVVSSAADVVGRDDVDAVAAAVDCCDPDWLAARRRDGLAVVALAGTADLEALDRVYRAGVDGHVHVEEPEECAAAQASLLWTQLRQRLSARSGGNLGLLDRDTLGHLSHELRTPLTAVCGTVEILAEELYGDLDAPLQECLEIALRNAAQLRQMIDDLLDATNVGTDGGEPSPARLETVAVVRDAVQAVQVAAAMRGTRVHLECAGDVPPVFADEMRVRQVMSNLLDNAVKFSPDSSDVRVAVTSDEDFVTISIRDQGAGIDPETARGLFEPLHRSIDGLHASRRGLGLGLFLAKRIVEQHGGRLTASPGPGGGTVFSFTLPLFSVDHLVSVMVDPAGDEQPPLNCIAVEVLAPERDIGEAAHDTVMVEAGQIVRSALRDSDLVCSGVPGHEHPGLIVVLTACDEVGAAAIETRLRVRLASSRTLRTLGIEARIESETIPVRSDAGTRPAPDVACDLARFLSLRFAPALSPVP